MKDITNYIVLVKEPARGQLLNLFFNTLIFPFNDFSFSFFSARCVFFRKTSYFLRSDSKTLIILFAGFHDNVVPYIYFDLR